MIVRSKVTRIIGAAVLSAAICLPSFAATRTVPGQYGTLAAAYNACVNGDIISVTSNQSTAGITVAKSITIQNGSANPNVTITLSSGFIIAANNVTFNSLKIIGKNASTSRCIQVNANVNGFYMVNCILTKVTGGSAGYAIYDLGSVSSSFHKCQFTGTNIGIYAENVYAMQTHEAAAFNNPSKNVYTKRAGTYTGDIGMWLEQASFYAGNSANAICFHAYNSLTSNIPWYWLEACSFQAWGTGAKCTKSETTDAMNAINLQGCTLTHCP